MQINFSSLYQHASDSFARVFNAGRSSLVILANRAAMQAELVRMDMIRLNRNFPLYAVAASALTAGIYSIVSFYRALDVPKTKTVKQIDTNVEKDIAPLTNEVRVTSEVRSVEPTINVPNKNYAMTVVNQLGKGLVAGSYAAFQGARSYAAYTGAAPSIVRTAITASPYTAAAGATLLGFTAASYAYKSAPSLQQSKDFMNKQWTATTNMVHNYTPSFASRAVQSTKSKLVHSKQAVSQSFANARARFDGPQA